MEIKDLLTEEHFSVYEELVEKVKSYFLKSGSTPKIMGFFVENEKHIRAIPTDNPKFEEARESMGFGGIITSFGNFLKEVRNLTPVAFIMISEIYLTKIKKDDEKSIEKLKEEGIHPSLNKQEGFMIHLETPKGSFHIVYDVIKVDDDFVVSPEPVISHFSTLEELDEAENKVGVGGFRYF